MAQWLHFYRAGLGVGMETTKFNPRLILSQLVFCLLFVACGGVATSQNPTEFQTLDGRIATHVEEGYEVLRPEFAPKYYIKDAGLALIPAPENKGPDDVSENSNVEPSMVPALRIDIAEIFGRDFINPQVSAQYYCFNNAGFGFFEMPEPLTMVNKTLSIWQFFRPISSRCLEIGATVYNADIKVFDEEGEVDDSDFFGLTMGNIEIRSN